MDPRISTLESDVAAIRADVEVIRADRVVKADLLASEHRLDSKIDSVKHELDGKIDGAKHELDGKIDGAKHELDGKIDGVKHELEKMIDGAKHELEQKIDGAKHELEKKIEGLQTRFETMRADVQVIRADRVVKADLLASEHRLDSKFDVLQTRFDTILPTLATKADFLQLSVSVRNWVLGTVLALFLSLGTMGVTMYNLVKPAAVSQSATIRQPQVPPPPRAPSPG